MRWRFVNAGANHQAFNHMWLGEKTDFTIDYKDKSGKKHTIDVYQSQTMYAVAFDGITTDKKVEFTANTPLLLAPGNRTDVLIKVPVDSDGKEYILFKYYPQDIAVIAPGVDISKVNASNVEDYLGWYCRMAVPLNVFIARVKRLSWRHFKRSLTPIYLELII